VDQAAVHAVPLFSEATRRERRRIAGLADEVEVEAGTMLIRRGDYAREFFVIESGHALVIRDGHLVTTLGPGEFFGEIGLIEGPARNATVIAATSMRLLAVARADFSTLMHAVPSIRAKVRGELASRLEAPSPRTHHQPIEEETTMKHAEPIGAFPIPFGPYAVQSAIASTGALARTVLRLAGSPAAPAAKLEAR
jgi:signal-transduction protein with cAMP-binding, CBS, and nucleotidyltransferase domain